MLTAGYMVATRLFKDEYKTPRPGYGRFVDDDVEPLDAPECMPAGSHQRCDVLGDDYVLPAVCWR